MACLKDIRQGLVIFRGWRHSHNEGMFWWWTGIVGYRPCRWEELWKSPWGFDVGVSHRLVLPTNMGHVEALLELGNWIFIVLWWRIWARECQLILWSNSILGPFRSIGSLPSWLWFCIFVVTSQWDVGRWHWKSMLLQSCQHKGKCWSRVSCVSTGLWCLAYVRIHGERKF